MTTRMEDEEWRRPENWRAGWLGIYVAPRDPRCWVPKRYGIGWTLNFGQRASWLWLALLLLPPLAVVLATMWRLRGS